MEMIFCKSKDFLYVQRFWYSGLLKNWMYDNNDKKDFQRMFNTEF